jgi:hypothetical protein
LPHKKQKDVMEYIDFFLFCLIAFGTPISLVLFKNRHHKLSLKTKSPLESGVPLKLRVTNRHKNVIYPIALMMIFTFVPLLLLIPIVVLRDSGEAYNKQLLIGLFVLISSFLGYWIFRYTGGLDDNK